jgi:hypothetical protein
MESGSFFFKLISQDWLLCLVIGYLAIRESRNADNRTYVDSFGTVPNLLIPIGTFMTLIGRDHSEHGPQTLGDSFG